MGMSAPHFKTTTQSPARLPVRTAKVCELAVGERSSRITGLDMEVLAAA
jgi:hypothetical protein